MLFPDLLYLVILENVGTWWLSSRALVPALSPDRNGRVAAIRTSSIKTHAKYTVVSRCHLENVKQLILSEPQIIA